MPIRDVWDMTHLLLTLSMAVSRTLNSIILIEDPAGFYQSLRNGGFIENEERIHQEATALSLGNPLNRGNLLLRPMGLQEDDDPAVFAYLIACFVLSTPSRKKCVMNGVRPIILKNVEYWRSCWGEFSAEDKKELAQYVGITLKPYLERYREKL